MKVFILLSYFKFLTAFLLPINRRKIHIHNYGYSMYKILDLTISLATQLHNISNLAIHKSYPTLPECVEIEK